MRAHAVALAFGVAWLGCGSAMADETAPPAAAPKWSFNVAVYGWAAGLSGDIAQFGLPKIEIDASFVDDVVQNLDFAAMIVGEIRRDRIGLFTDLVYVKLSGANGTPRGVLAGNVSLDMKSLAFTAAPEYRVFETPRGSLDLMAGMRLWSIDTALAFSGGAFGGARRSDGDTWVDPLIGAKGRLDLTSGFSLSGWAMIGGFGASSDLMWDAWGGVGYQFNDTVSAVLGYRAMSVDYQDGGFEYDVIQHGPVIGGVFRF